MLLSSKDLPHTERVWIDGQLRTTWSVNCDSCDVIGTWRPDGAVGPKQVLAHFRHKGWGISHRDRTHDVCPRCMAGRLNFQPRPARQQLVNSVAVVAPPPPPPLEPPPLELSFAELAPAPKKKRKSFTRTPRAFRPLYLPIERLGEHSYGFNTRGFLYARNAEEAAKNYLGKLGIADPQRDSDFVVYKLENGWAWDVTRPGLVVLVEPFEVLPFPDLSQGRNRTVYTGGANQAPFQGSDFVYPPDNPKVRRRNDALATRGITQTYSAMRLARIYLLHAGQVPWEGVNWRRWQDPATGLWGWDLIGPAPTPTLEEEKPMPDDIRPEASATDDAPPQAALMDRRVIRHYLDRNYDEEQARWRGDFCDAKAAKDLGLPTAWIAGVRAESYGPDRNEIGDTFGRDIAELAKRQIALGHDVTELVAQGMAFSHRVDDVEAKQIAFERDLAEFVTKFAEVGGRL